MSRYSDKSDSMLLTSNKRAVLLTSTKSIVATAHMPSAYNSVELPDLLI